MRRTIICIVALILLDIGVLCWSCSGRLVPQARMRQEALNIVLIATPWTAEEQRRSGTWATIRYAWQVKKRVAIIRPDGTISI